MDRTPSLVSSGHAPPSQSEANPTPSPSSRRGRGPKFLIDIAPFLNPTLSIQYHTTPLPYPKLHQHTTHIMASDGYELLCLENPLLDILGADDPVCNTTMDNH